MQKFTLLILFALLWLPVWAAVGCDLNDPDKDVARLFPGSTGYKTSYRTLSREGGKALLAKVEADLGDKFSGLYETIDIPYTLYTIYKGESKIGYIHGVNQKGRYGGLQIFLSLDNTGRITNMYLQKISSKNAKLFRAEAFTAQFTGLNQKDLATWDVGKGSGKGKTLAIKNPAPGDPDFAAIMRGVKKNLALMRHFAGW
ncbi:MAG: hypothetical protein K0B87_00620 [Candidatus Syntrophosphaera sp.]|nr:hypothetical protein [Candidatus Syntrophosphaera sp.]